MFWKRALLHTSKPVKGWISEVVRTGIDKGIKSMADSHSEMYC